MIEIKARGIADGSAAGPALIGDEAISFLGDVDIGSGQIVGDLPSLKNASVRGTVLIFPYTRGSAGRWRLPQQPSKPRKHTGALITHHTPDPAGCPGGVLAHHPIQRAPPRPHQ